MSGNTIALGRAVAHHDLGQAAARAWPILTFTFGLFVSELAYELARRRGRPSGAGWTLGPEAGAVALVSILPWPAARSTSGLAYYLPTGLLAVAMGLQNATLVRVGASSVYTTRITGNIRRLSREAAHSLLWIVDRARRRVRGNVTQQQSMRRVLLMAALWVAYGAGAALGALAADHWNRRGALVPSSCWRSSSRPTRSSRLEATSRPPSPTRCSDLF